MVRLWLPFVHVLFPLTPVLQTPAINMAKALLPKVPCEDLANEADVNCIMQILVRDIIQTQNLQIQTMRAVNEVLGAPPTDSCQVVATNMTTEKVAAAPPCPDMGGCTQSPPGEERYRMYHQTFDSFCMTTCIVGDQVEERTASGWKCGGCP